MEICDSDGMTGDGISHWQEQYYFLNKLLNSLIEVFIIQKLFFFGPLNFKLTRFYCINHHDFPFVIIIGYNKYDKLS
jgi:hypothetical protein